ncbi:recombinase family protein [Lysinibacillus sp. LZ02]|uniref:recombinase family protein n=1 Tax=Lysinibacillus sp. LZ02 TaxID=3420668 RepID=UPI003D35D537
MIYGYKRPIQGDEQMTNQLTTVEVDQLYIEQHPYAKKRTQLEDLLMNLQSGDEVYVENIVVLADSLTQFEDLLKVVERDEVAIHFLHDNISSTSMLQLSLIEATTFFAKLQTACMSHRTTFGMQEAKKQGKAIGRPKKSDDNLKRAFHMYQSKKYTLQAIKEETGISKSTLYRYIDHLGE